MDCISEKNSGITVSVICNAYNQKKYIKSALDSFVSQKTDFAVEYLIHDDASTDGTADVIREYEKKYPELIKPIYETENQYSKHDGTIDRVQKERARGKYIAYCEGDDYWIDERKLQKQVDYMESHPDCTMCFTNGLRKRDGETVGRVVPSSDENAKYYKPGDSDYDFPEMLFLDYVPTASLVFPAEIIKNLPEKPRDVFGGDTFLRMSAVSFGYAHCIDEDTCVYRVGVEGSLMTQWRSNVEENCKFNRRFMNMCDFLDKLTGGKYHADLMKMKLMKEFQICRATADSKNLKRKEFRVLIKTMGRKDRLCYYAIVYVPRLYRLYLKLKKQ